LNLLISHRVPLDKIEFAFRLATHPGEFPGENPLKIIVRPQELAGLPRSSAQAEGSVVRGGGLSAQAEGSVVRDRTIDAR
jgi:hypothetical protein